MYKVLLAILVIIGLVWKFGPRRAKEPGFEFVYVNQDGSVRELSPGERDYLSREFSGGDSGRPYIKFSYESCDGWGSQSGFIERRRVPQGKSIGPVNPNYDQLAEDSRLDMLAANRAAGDLIVEKEDGSVLCSPNPDLSRKKRFALIRDFERADQRRREALADVEEDN